MIVREAPALLDCSRQSKTGIPAGMPESSACSRFELTERNKSWILEKPEYSRNSQLPLDHLRL